MSAHEMLALKRILCPTDFSECSTAAFAMAVDLARVGRGQIRVLHVCPFVFSSVALELPYLPAPEATSAGARAKLQDELRHFVHPAEAASVPVECVARDGDPADQILRDLQVTPADLIVMGRHSRKLVDRWILGSVAERVLLGTAVPVAAVPQRFSLSASGGPVRVLCAVELDATSTSTLAYAAALARELQAELFVLHVLDAVEGEPWRGMIPVEVALYRHAAIRDARERLEALAPDALLPDGGLERWVATGAAHTQILETARQIGADLVILGSHPHMILLGTTVRHVLRRAPCPVFVVPSHAGVYAGTAAEEAQAVGSTPGAPGSARR
jgi:nucleotide-binding universal stress UspA family protein